MRVDIVSIFPEYFAPLDLSLIGKARGSGLLDLSVHDLRTWTTDVHRTGPRMRARGVEVADGPRACARNACASSRMYS